MNTKKQLFTLTPGQCIEGVFESKGSKFLAYLFVLELSEHCPTPKTALHRHIEELKKIHPKAVHFVSAMRFLDSTHYSCEGDLAFGEKSGSLPSGVCSHHSHTIVDGSHYRLGNSFASNLHNPDFSSKILECQEASPNAEFDTDLESKADLLLDSNTESNPIDSKAISESTNTTAPSTTQTCNQIIESSSDDGEPKGSSGVPCLNVLRGEKLINVACVIVRYFGGTLLGVGGLVRAYTAATHDAIANAKATHAITPFIEQHDLWLSLPYTQFSKAQYLAQTLNITLAKKNFTESGVEILCYGTLKALERFKNKL